MPSHAAEPKARSERPCHREPHAQFQEIVTGGAPVQKIKYRIPGSQQRPAGSGRSQRGQKISL